MLAAAGARAANIAPLCLFLLLVSACGDDSGSSAPAKDAGVADGGGMDAGMKTTMIPRRDAQTTTVDPVPPCDRNDPSACGSGMTCDLVVRRAAGDTQYQFYTGCVENQPERAEGDPCDPDPRDGTPYRVPGLTDEVFRDQCGPGLVCSPARNIRNGFTCQTVCSTGQLDENPVPCSSPTSICFPGTQISEYCREADHCDVTKQTGCLSGEACFIAPNDNGDQLITLCSSPATMPDADGDATCGFLSCKPGSVCLGPVHLPITKWTRADVKCRPVCTTPGANDDVDAGENDAGVDRGGCSTSTSCEAFSESGLGLSSIPKPPYGQCE
jgi:hypothetical protein